MLFLDVKNSIGLRNCWELAGPVHSRFFWHGKWVVSIVFQVSCGKSKLKNIVPLPLAGALMGPFMWDPSKMPYSDS